jgi:hypothetical protein
VNLNFVQRLDFDLHHSGFSDELLFRWDETHALRMRSRNQTRISTQIDKLSMKACRREGL